MRSKFLGLMLLRAGSICGAKVPQNHVRKLSMASYNLCRKTTAMSSQQQNLTLEKICSDVMLHLKTANFSNVSAMATVLYDYGCPPQEIPEILKLSPELIGIAPQKAKVVLQTLMENGFSPEQCLQVAALEPSIIREDIEILKKTLAGWRLVGLEESNMIELLSEQPQLFSLNHNKVRRRINQLQIYFESKKIGPLLMRCPTLLRAKWDDIRVKVDYLSEEMVITRKEIQNSTALSHSLVRIRLRHEFLYRAGLYLRPNPKSTVPTKNPSLKNIVCTDDEEFTTKVCCMSLEEYLVFQEMFKEQLEDELTTDSDSDTDSE